MMYLIGKDGARYDLVDISSIYFWYDVGSFVEENFEFLVTSRPYMLDVLYAHAWFWYTPPNQLPNGTPIENGGPIHDAIFSNELLKVALDEHTPTVQTVIFAFDGIQIHEEVIGSPGFQSGDEYVLEIRYGQLHLEKEFLDENPNEDLDPEEPIDPVDNPLYDFRSSFCSSVFYLMREEDAEKMYDYLEQCLKELNIIYKAHGIPEIRMNFA